MLRMTRRSFAKHGVASSTPLVLGGMLLNSPLTAIAQTKKRIRVGQIGTKHGHAIGKLEAIRKYSDHFEIVGVVEEDSVRRDEVKATAPFQHLTWMTTEELLKQPGLQLVLIETDIDDLLPMAERSLAAGLHVHLDKPAGTSLDHFRRVTALAAEKKRLIQLGYMFRSNPAFKFLYEAVKQGWLGEIFEIHGVMSKQVGAAERAPLARYRGGSMFELGCHLIDSVVKLLGKPTFVVPSNRQTHPELDQLSDNCLAVFHYPKATATIRSSVIEVEGNRRRQFNVCGTLGTIVIEPLEAPQLTLTLDRARGDYKKGAQVVELPTAGGRYDAELLSLAAAIRGDMTFEYSFEHDLIVQACVLQASEMS